LIGHTNNLETGAIDTVDEVGSLNNQRRDGERVSGEQRNEGEDGNSELLFG